jgi:hypothetical protein
MKDTPVNVINTKTAALIPIRIVVKDMAEGRCSDGTTDGMGGAEFSVAWHSRQKVLSGPVENAGNSRPQLMQFAIENPA